MVDAPDDALTRTTLPPACATYTLPRPSAAMPVASLKPLPSDVTEPLAKTTSSESQYCEAENTVPAASTATPHGWQPCGGTPMVVVAPDARLTCFTSWAPQSATYTLPMASTATPVSNENPPPTVPTLPYGGSGGEGGGGGGDGLGGGRGGGGPGGAGNGGGLGGGIGGGPGRGSGDGGDGLGGGGGLGGGDGGVGRSKPAKLSCNRNGWYGPCCVTAHVTPLHVVAYAKP